MKEEKGQKIDIKSKLDKVLDETENDTNETVKVIQEEYEEIETEIKDIVDNSSVDDRIKNLYEYNIEKSLIKDKNGILTSYIESLYNPITTKLDKYNLLLNLLVLSKLLDIDIINFYFDDTMKKYSMSEYHLEIDSYKDIMKQNVDNGSKYVHILNKKINLSFYRAMFEAIITKADRMAYNETSLKMKRVWNYIDSNDDSRFDMEEYLVEFIAKKTIEGSVIMVTPDLTKYFKLDYTNIETYIEKPYVKYIGKWNSRLIYEIDTEQITNLKGFKKGTFFIKDGNTYLINPEKPLIYFNVIENEFLEKPILKLFASFDFNFITSSTTFLKIDM